MLFHTVAPAFDKLRHEKIYFINPPICIKYLFKKLGIENYRWEQAKDGTTYGAFAANGHGGKYLFVAPVKNLVVVYTAWPYTNGDMQDWAMQLIEPIYKACKN